MKRKRIGIILAILGAIIAIGVGYYVYITAEETQALAAQTPKVQVVVALADLQERMPVPAAALTTTLVPESIVPAGAATNVNDVVGKFPLTTIYRNEVVNAGKLADSSAKAGPSFSLKPGMVTFTYPGSDLLSPTGALRPGDRIDVLLSLSLARQATAQASQQSAQAAAQAAAIPVVSQTLLQNVEVLKVGSFPAAGSGEAPGGKSVTFQVSHQDALVLKWAKDSGGTIDLVLRHPTDKEPVDTEAITASYVLKKYKFQFSDPLQ